jgi:hypothetical protein
MSGVKTIAVGKGTVLLALAAGPVLGVAIFLVVAGGIGAPPGAPGGERIQVPWHKSTRLTALEVKRIGPDTVEVLTRRDAKSGTTYVLRRIDCAAREFEYLGEGATEQQARAGHAADTRKTRVADNSIPYYVAAHACPGWKPQ